MGEIDVNQQKHVMCVCVCVSLPVANCDDSYDLSLSLGAQEFEGRNHQTN